MKTYVINLPEAIERRRFMEAQLSMFPFLVAEFIPAIRGKGVPAYSLATVVDEELCRSRLGRALTPGEIGCALSHIEVFKKIEEDNVHNALVLEDDALLSETRRLTGIRLEALVPYCVGLSLSENTPSSNIEARQKSEAATGAEARRSSFLQPFCDLFRRVGRGIVARLLRIKAQPVHF